MPDYKKDWYFAVLKTMGMQQLNLYLRTALLALLLAACQPSNDGKIEKSVQSGVSLLDPNVQVSVADGVVTLRGAVKDSTTRSSVETGVKEMKGVKSVINQLTVK